ISHLKQQLDQYQKDNIKLISDQACYIFIFKITLIEIEKLKKDIESKDNEIQIKQEIQFKQKQIHENKEEQKQNIIHHNSSSSIINTSSTSDFQLLRSFKLINTFTGHTSY
ncbi:hypothetical protein RFI_35678, partial [Reticulomyxa filosa]